MFSVLSSFRVLIRTVAKLSEIWTVCSATRKFHDNRPSITSNRKWRYYFYYCKSWTIRISRNSVSKPLQVVSSSWMPCSWILPTMRWYVANSSNSYRQVIQGNFCVRLCCIHPITTWLWTYFCFHKFHRLFSMMFLLKMTRHKWFDSSVAKDINYHTTTCMRESYNESRCY